MACKLRLAAGVVFIAPWLGACGGGDSVAGAPVAALSCEALTSVVSDATTITSATSVASPLTVGGITVDSTFCRVQGLAKPSADSQIKFEVWLPATAAAWTGRMKVNGTGAYAGATPYARLAQDIGDGFVTAGSNMGHDGGESADWTLNHPERVKDWGLRAHYFVATAAKAVANAFYAKPVAHSYFEGCSNGGRQAMMMAQRYPDLFDGIAAGAPSMFYPDVLMWLLWQGELLTPTLGQPTAMPTAKLALLSQASHATCDANDGLVDGQITSPKNCSFDPSVLRCTGADSPTCLTDQQVLIAKESYRGPHTDTGVQRYSGAMPGSETQWDPNFADNGGYGVFAGHYVYSMLTPPFNWRTLNFSSDYDVIKAGMTATIAAPSPDLSAFKAHGGKMIHFHGWDDPIVPPLGSTNYFNALAEFEKIKSLPKATVDQLVETLSPGEVTSNMLALAPVVQEYHRLFMFPEVGHCTLGSGTGPLSVGGGFPEPPKSLRDADHHVVSALIKWVEQGSPPEAIIATKYAADGTITRQRPVCPYPKEAVYKGTGDVNAAANFSCATPAPDKLVTTPTDIIQIQNSLRQRDVLSPNR